MIVEWLMSLGAAVSGFFADFFAEVDVPGWLTNSTGSVYAFLSGASGLGNWFPWAILSACIGVSLTVYAISLLARVVQKVWGLIPVIGGSG